MCGFECVYVCASQADIGRSECVYIERFEPFRTPKMGTHGAQTSLTHTHTGLVLLSLHFDI